VPSGPEEPIPIIRVEVDKFGDKVCPINDDLVIDVAFDTNDTGASVEGGGDGDTTAHTKKNVAGSIAKSIQEFNAEHFEDLNVEGGLATGSENMMNSAPLEDNEEVPEAKDRIIEDDVLQIPKLKVKEYLPGSLLFFGSVIALSCRTVHGNRFLRCCIDKDSVDYGKVTADAVSCTEHGTHFEIVTMLGYRPGEPLQYYNNVWLKNTETSLLLSSETFKDSFKQTLYGPNNVLRTIGVPKLATERGGEKMSRKMATQTARWTFLPVKKIENEKENSFGHLSEVILEHEWMYLSGHSKGATVRNWGYGPEILKEKVVDPSGVWRIRIVDNPTSTINTEEKVLVKASRQLNTIALDRKHGAYNFANKVRATQHEYDDEMNQRAKEKVAEHMLSLRGTIVKKNRAMSEQGFALQQTVTWESMNQVHEPTPVTPSPTASEVIVTENKALKPTPFIAAKTNFTVVGLEGRISRSVWGAIKNETSEFEKNMNNTSDVNALMVLKRAFRRYLKRAWRRQLAAEDKEVEEKLRVESIEERRMAEVRELQRKLEAQIQAQDIQTEKRRQTLLAIKAAKQRLSVQAGGGDVTAISDNENNKSKWNLLKKQSSSLLVNGHSKSMSDVAFVVLAETIDDPAVAVDSLTTTGSDCKGKQGPEVDDKQTANTAVRRPSSAKPRKASTSPATSNLDCISENKGAEGASKRPAVLDEPIPSLRRPSSAQPRKVSTFLFSDLSALNERTDLRAKATTISSMTDFFETRGRSQDTSNSSQNVSMSNLEKLRTLHNSTRSSSDLTSEYVTLFDERDEDDNDSQSTDLELSSEIQLYEMNGMPEKASVFDSYKVDLIHRRVNSAGIRKKPAVGLLGEYSKHVQRPASAAPSASASRASKLHPNQESDADEEDRGHPRSKGSSTKSTSKKMLRPSSSQPILGRRSSSTTLQAIQKIKLYRDSDFVESAKSAKAISDEESGLAKTRESGGGKSRSQTKEKDSTRRMLEHIPTIHPFTKPSGDGDGGRRPLAIKPYISDVYTVEYVLRSKRSSMNGNNRDNHIKRQGQMPRVGQDTRSAMTS
jgi:hypothetical protein